MFHNGFVFCGEHKNWTPRGRICPDCNGGIKERQKAALHPCWRDIIPRTRMLEFMKMEHIYCRDEEQEFHGYSGNDLTYKEELRALVLEKRQEFLQLFIEIMKEERKGVRECL